MPTILVSQAFLVNKLFRGLKFAWNKAVRGQPRAKGHAADPACPRGGYYRVTAGWPVTGFRMNRASFGASPNP